VREIPEDKEEDQSEVSGALDKETSAVEEELDPKVQREENLEREEDLLEVDLPIEALEKL
jgi:hypothetical protein